MSTTRQRTNSTKLTKPRATQRKLREAEWIANGGRLTSNAEKVSARRAVEMKTTKIDFLYPCSLTTNEGPLANPGQVSPDDLETLESVMHLAAPLMSKELKVKFALLVVRLMNAMAPQFTPVLANFVETYQGSKRDAYEAAAAKFGIPAATFDGAVAQVKRMARPGQK